MADLKRQYDEKLQQKEELRKKSDFMEMMLDRASQLVSGLIGEKERWENTVTVCLMRSDCIDQKMTPELVLRNFASQMSEILKFCRRIECW